MQSGHHAIALGAITWINHRDTVDIPKTVPQTFGPWLVEAVGRFKCLRGKEGRAVGEAWRYPVNKEGVRMRNGGCMLKESTEGAIGCP
ncbi:hypothetical protein WL40_10770 [Burkholderia ubonensis]|nr:hypothetical protein WL40_10770 [Burkholderia ubonensis]